MEMEIAIHTDVDEVKHILIDIIIERVYEEGHNVAIKDALKIIDDELSSWERVREELGAKPEDDNAEAALAVVRSLIEELTEDKS